MKFISDKICWGNVLSIEEAATKAKNTREVPKLDDLLAEIDAKNKSDKVAAAQGVVEQTRAQLGIGVKKKNPRSPKTNLPESSSPKTRKSSS